VACLAETGPLRAELARLAGFVAVGVFNTAVTFGLYQLFLLFVRYEIAFTLSFASGIGISYVLNGRLVFDSRLSLRRGLTYAGYYLLIYLVNLGLVRLAVEVGDISPVWAPLLVLCVTIPMNFIGAKLILR
jgi:putative flippase GtrA